MNYTNYGIFIECDFNVHHEITFWTTLYNVIGKWSWVVNKWRKQMTRLEDNDFSLKTL